MLRTETPHGKTRRRITPANAVHHRALQDEVVEFLKSQSVYIWEWTYHDSLPASVVDDLTKQSNPTALFLRTRADLVAISKLESVLIEIKSIPRNHKNLAVEALPLAYHVAMHQLMGVLCLYIFRDHQGREGCFLASRNRLPRISCIIIPESVPVKQASWYGEIFQENFPGVPIRRVPSVSGSGDPFAIIQHQDLPFSDWRETLLAILKPH